MRRFRGLLTSSVVLILILTTVVMSPSIAASSSRSRTTTRDERYASMSGTMWSNSGRYETTISLEVATTCQVDKANLKTCTQGFNLRIFQYDHQDDRVSFSGSLSDLPPIGAPPHQTVDTFATNINGQLNRAQFNLQGTIFNSEDFFHTLFPVTLSQRWAGYGSIARNDSQETVQEDGKTIQQTSRSTDRDARPKVEFHLAFPADYPAEDINISGSFGEGHLARLVIARSEQPRGK